MKPCFKCGFSKPLAEFYRHPGMSDGHLNKCKGCAKIDVQENYQKRRDYYAGYEKDRAQQPGRKMAAAGYQRIHRSRDRAAYQARTAVGNAIRDGRLQRKPCQTCGSDKSEAHHFDYTKALDVEWLCRHCHLQEHARKAY